MSALLYVGSSLVTLWGIAHVFPTQGVVKDFGDITEDNKRIITMEWLMEAVLMITIGVFVIVVTAIDNTSDEAIAVYSVASGSLVVMAVISLFTGSRIAFLPFRLCPVIFTISAILIALGAGFS